MLLYKIVKPIRQKLQSIQNQNNVMEYQNKYRWKNSVIPNSVNINFKAL